MKSISKNLITKCKRIKLVLTDVDGVLTDGGMYYSEKGEIMKKFNTKDGMGVELLRRNGIKTILITKENSKIVIKRGKKINAVDVLVNVKNKEFELERICKKFSIKKENIAFIGDDINDLEIMKNVGVSTCPSDAVTEILKISDYICEKRGGEGVLREFTNLVLKSHE